MSKIYRFTEAQKEELSVAYKRSKESRETARLLAVRMIVCFGSKVEEAAEIALLSPSHTRKLLSLYANKGLQVLLAKKQGGNSRLISFEAEAEILKEFEASAKEGKQISAKDIEARYNEVCGRKVSNSQIYYVLKRHNWRVVKPRQKHPKSDPLEQEAYKKNSVRDKRCTQER